jgi:hypothetical protein
MALTPEGTPYVESSDLVANYPAASLALANRVDLVGVLPFATSTARGTAIPSPTDGQYSYLQDSNTTEFWNGSAWVAAGGKVLQVVRATDTTNRTTTSTSFVDVTGMSVTITPKSATSSIIISAVFNPNVTSTTNASRVAFYQITDSSNVAISGAQNIEYGVINSTTAMAYTLYGGLNMRGYVTTGSVSAVTYKLRFSVNAASCTALVQNATSTGQMFAMEVAA